MKLGIAAKLGGGFALCLVLMVGGNLLALRLIERMQANTRSLKSDQLAVVRQVGRIERALLLVRNDSLTLRQEFTPSVRAKLDGSVSELERQVDALRPLIYSEKGKAFIASLDESLATAVPALNSAAAEGRRSSGARWEAADAALASGSKGVEEFLGFKDRQAADAAKESERLRNQVVASMVTLTIAATLAGSLVAFLLVRYVTRRVRAVGDGMRSLTTHCIRDLEQAVSALSRGDLTAEVRPVTEPLAVGAQDEFGHMAQVFNDLLDQTKRTVHSYGVARENLRQMVGAVQTAAEEALQTSERLSHSVSKSAGTLDEVSRSVEDVASGASESARGSESVARGSERLTAASADSAQAVEQMVSAVDELREQGKQQLEQSKAASSTADEGVRRMNDTRRAMDRIDEQVRVCGEAVQRLGDRGRQIGDIVEAINQIAEQTNLLALNAAIEAARAGEHGRGFAVVADEVRKLAERAGESAQQVVELVQHIQSDVSELTGSMDQSVSEVAQGARLSAETEEFLTTIKSGVEEIRQAILRSNGLIDEVSRQGSTMASMVREVVTVSQDASATSEELSAMAEEVSAAASEVTRSIQDQNQELQQIASAAEALEETSRSLHNLAHQFSWERREEDWPVPVERRHDDVVTAAHKTFGSKAA